MADVARALETPPIRPEFTNERKRLGHIGDVARPLSTWERLSNLAFVRRLVIIAILAVTGVMLVMSVNTTWRPAAQGGPNRMRLSGVSTRPLMLYLPACPLYHRFLNRGRHRTSLQ